MPNVRGIFDLSAYFMGKLETFAISITPIQLDARTEQRLNDQEDCVFWSCKSVIAEQSTVNSPAHRA